MARTLLHFVSTLASACSSAPEREPSPRVDVSRTFSPFVRNEPKCYTKAISGMRLEPWGTENTSGRNV